jgi:hypothetical protein
MTTRKRQIMEWRRNPTDPLKPIAIYADEREQVEVQTGDRSRYVPQDLLHRLVGVGRQDSRWGQVLGEHAPGLLETIRDAQSAPDQHHYERAFARFDAEASQILYEIRGGKRQGKGDAGLFTLLAPIHAMTQFIEQLVIEPQLSNLLPQLVLNTVLEQGIYMEYVPGIAQAATSWEYGTEGAVASGVLTPKLTKLAPVKTSVVVSGREREKFAEMRGKMGAPDWDLLQHQIMVAMREAGLQASRIVAHGDPTQGIFGLLSDTALTSIPAANVNFNSGTGLTDANAILGQITLQAGQVGYDQRLLADTVIFDAESFWALSSRGVSSTGDSDDNVIGRVFKFAPGVDTITYAIECGPNTALETALTAKVGATEAARLRGGYNDGGTTKRCMVIMRRDIEQVGAAVTGIPLSYEPLDDRDGATRGQCRTSSGGYKAFRPEAHRIAYL